MTVRSYSQTDIVFYNTNYIHVKFSLRIWKCSLFETADLICNGVITRTRKCHNVDRDTGVVHIRVT